MNTKTTRKPGEPLGPAIQSVLLREEANGARWYRTTFANGTTLTLCIPGRDEEEG